MSPTASRILYGVWLAEASVTGRQQPPVEQLIAEHHLMSSVLLAMEAEAEGMLTGRPLRPDFWRDLVDFNGNFVHLCHRVKEEQHLIPALVAAGLLDPSLATALGHEHESGKSLTLDLCDSVGNGDWESVLRLVSIYAHLLRPHMRREESGAFAGASTLPAAAQSELSKAFEGVERTALQGRGRAHYAEVARRLAKACGLTTNV